jgi:hypothetical protein
LVGQNKGYFFRKRYKVATIFVDHFSRLSFVHLQESTKGEETLLAKRAFEAYAASFGVVIRNYHADNGRFTERLFLEHAESHGQTVYYVESMPIFKMALRKSASGTLLNGLEPHCSTQ